MIPANTVASMYIRRNKLNELLRFMAEYWELPRTDEPADSSSDSLCGAEFSKDILDAVRRQRYGFVEFSSEDIEGIDFLVFEKSSITKYDNSDLDGYRLTQLLKSADYCFDRVSCYRCIPFTEEILELALEKDLIFKNEPRKVETPKGTQTASNTATVNQQQGNTKMSGIKTAISATAATQKDAALLAAKISVGGAANTLVAKMVKPKVGMLLGGHVNSPLGKLVIANLTQYAVNQFAPNNAKAAVISEAMVQAATIEALGQLDLESIIEDITSKISGAKVDALMGETSDKVVVD